MDIAVDDDAISRLDPASMPASPPVDTM